MRGAAVVAPYARTLALTLTLTLALALALTLTLTLTLTRSPVTHELFPTAARARAATLLRLGYLLSARFAGYDLP